MYKASYLLTVSSFANLDNVMTRLCFSTGAIIIGSEKFGGNSWPSGGNRENVGGGMCTSFTSIGNAADATADDDIIAMLCSMLGGDSV